MNKQDLINRTAEVAGVSRAVATNVLNSAISAIHESAQRGERIEVKGLMIVNVTDKPARSGRNPLTGKEIQLPARRAVTIKPAASLKLAANIKAKE